MCRLLRSFELSLLKWRDEFWFVKVSKDNKDPFCFCVKKDIGCSGFNKSGTDGETGVLTVVWGMGTSTSL